MEEKPTGAKASLKKQNGLGFNKTATLTNRKQEVLNKMHFKAEQAFTVKTPLLIIPTNQGLVKYAIGTRKNSIDKKQDAF